MSEKMKASGSGKSLPLIKHHPERLFRGVPLSTFSVERVRGVNINKRPVTSHYYSLSPHVSFAFKE